MVTSFLKLIRLPNLLFVVLAQCLLRYAIFDPVFNAFGMELSLSDFEFTLLVFSTVLVAAAGYIINDYFDVKIDAINKPGRMLVGTKIKRQHAMALHLVLNFSGILIGFYLAWQIGKIQVGAVHLISAGLLWFYSTTYKRQMIIGNLVVSILTALVIAVVGFYEPKIYDITPESQSISGILLTIVLLYSFFAFLISMIREIIKDMEDMKGDSSYDCKTLPLILGVKKAKVVVSVLDLFLVGVIGYIQYHLWLMDKQAPFWFIFIAIQLPLILVIAGLIPAKEKKEFHRLSILVKMIMLSGIFTMLFYYFLFKS